MKNIKRIAVLLMVMALCASLFSVAAAKSDKHGEDDDKDGKTPATLSADVQTLKTLGLLIGTGKDGLTLEYTHSKPTRIQGFIIYLRLIGKEQDADNFDYDATGHGRGHHDNFDDHEGNSSYVQKMMAFAKAHPELHWVGANGKFNPMAHLSAKEYAKIMLTALGYVSDVDFTWNNVESFANGLGLDIPKGDFTFEKLATMTVETLYTTMKGSSQTLIDYLASQSPDFAAKVALLKNGSTTDTTKPTVTDVVLSAPYTAGPPAVSGQVTVYFSEAMKADTLTNPANYSADLDGSGSAYAAVPLSALTGASVTAAADYMSVTLTIPGSALNGGDAAGAGITDITVSGLKDLAGNAMDPVTRFVRKASALTVGTAAATDINKLQVTFNNPLKTVDPTEFRLYKTDGITLVSVGIAYTLDASGRTATITMGGALTAAAKAVDADSTAAKLAMGTTNTKDIFGNAVSGPAAVPIVDASTPATVVILDKIAPSVSSAVKGAAAYTVDVTFTEPVNAVDQGTLSAALQIKNLGGTVQAATYAFSGAGGTITNFTKLTATIIGATADKYTVELLGQGIKDLAGNTVNAYPKTTVTVQTSDAPVIVSAETQDLNKDGYIDAIKLTFNKNINDSTVNANNFDVPGYSFAAFYPTTAGDTANNNVIYITFPEKSVPDTGVTPTITYTQGTLADTTGHKLASTGPILTSDKAAPVVISALPVGSLTAGGTTSSAALTLSEDVTAADQAAIVAAIQAKITTNDLVTTGDIATSFVWTTNRQLTVSITANANGGVNPDSITLAAATADLVDAGGNTTSAAQIVK